MRYTASCRQALEAIRGVEDDGGQYWWPDILLALVKLLPGPAISHALADRTVWSSERRRDLRRAITDGILGGRTGIAFDGLIAAIEHIAGLEGSTVRERHLVLAMAEHRTSLLELGVDVDRLVEVTTAREGSQFPEEALQIAALYPSDQAQAAQLAAAEVELTLETLLALDERNGSVEWKRSIFNDRKHRPGVLSSHQTAAVALVNGNPEREVLLVFGVDDDKTVVGQVTQGLDPLTDLQVKESQRRFVECMQATVPPVRVAWARLSHPDGEIVVARMRGRRRGVPVRTSYGAYPYRSGEDTYPADPATLAGWVAEEDPQLRRLLEARAESDSRISSVLEELARGQRDSAARERANLFARIDIVGSGVGSDGSGSITIRHMGGREPARNIQAWALRERGAGVGQLPWLLPGDTASAALSPTTAAGLAAGPFPEWGQLDLADGEYLMGVAWEGLQREARRGRSAWVMSKDGNMLRHFIDEWDKE